MSFSYHQTYSLDPTSEKSKGGRGVPDPQSMLEKEGHAQFYREKICGGVARDRVLLNNFKNSGVT